ncbi:MAG: GntR family transcriptional regulator [Treponema sp.]|jgi:GntR family transcriptional regulator, rspAB operon transcriptional repressor|nr:GntR family transcriptional regulator [Treponema sp.]
MKNIEKLEKETNRDYAFRVMRNNIVNLELTPGSMLSEQDIAEELHLSRTPVHEALQELARTTIIEILPQKGSLVSLVDMNKVDEAVFLRSTIESAITEEACKIATEEDIRSLEENISLQDFYHDQNSIDKIMELDNAFHEKMYKITNKMQCHYVVKLMNIHYDRFREMKLHALENKPIIDEHKEILQTFIQKNPKKAKELVLSHINRLYIDEKEIRSKYPTFFL